MENKISARKQIEEILKNIDAIAEKSKYLQ